MGTGEFGNYNLHTLEEVLVDLLSVVLWHQHIGVEYLKVVEVGIQIFLFFFPVFLHSSESHWWEAGQWSRCRSPYNFFLPYTIALLRFRRHIGQCSRWWPRASETST